MLDDVRTLLEVNGIPHVCFTPLIQWPANFPNVYTLLLFSHLTGLCILLLISQFTFRLIGCLRVCSLVSSPPQHYMVDSLPSGSVPPC